MKLKCDKGWKRRSGAFAGSIGPRPKEEGRGDQEASKRCPMRYQDEETEYGMLKRSQHAICFLQEMLPTGPKGVQEVPQEAQIL